MSYLNLVLLKIKETTYEGVLIPYYLFCSYQLLDVKVFINPRISQNTSELCPIPLIFVVFQREQKGRIIE